MAAARRIAYELDPHSVVDRNRRAAQERAVTLRPAPDTMAYLTALLPVADAVAAYAALGRAADSHRGSAPTGRAEPDRRSRGQVMAHTLLERLTDRGHVSALADGGPTTTDNGQGLCERCNHAKQALDWRARCAPGPRHTVELTTPTGHTYRSTAPPPPGAGRHATFTT